MTEILSPNYLASTIDWSSDVVFSFEFVRDEIAHSGDTGTGAVTIRASEVMEEMRGLCYAKSKSYTSRTLLSETQY